MASWADKIPTFNSYVQQLPVEAMVKVGMQKQAQYEEGIQKIQTNIDNVAGLDVANDVDKQYLQSKLDSLGNDLKMVAAGDFSNFQLVNSVNGMTKQISKDKNVINAVSSTAWLRKQQAEMEKAISEGKSSQENQWDFGEKANRYLNSTKVGDKFNDRYTQYIDVNKKWMEVMKSLHSDLAEQDVPYARNDDGSINYNKTAAAMQRLSKETVSSAKIENALRSSLSPDELNQLSISGRYTFRQFDTPDKLAVYSQTRFGKQIELNNERIKELDGLCNLSASNPELQKKAQDTIDSLQIKNKQLGVQLNDELESIKSNPDQAKSIIYKNGAIAEFANTYAWEHNKENLLTNPVLQADYQEKKQALDLAEFRLRVRGQNWDEYKDKFNMDMTSKEYQLKVAKQQADLYGVANPFETYLGQNTNVKDPLLAMIEDEAAYGESASAGIVDMVKGIPGSNSTQIKNAIEKYKNGDPNWYKIGNGNTAKAIPVEWRETVNAIIDNQDRANRLNAARTKVINEVNNSPEFIQGKKKLDQEIKTFAPVSMRDANGRTIVFSPQEVANFAEKRVNKPGKYIEGAAFVADVTYNAPLTAREKLLSKLNVNNGTFNNFSKIVSKVSDYKRTSGNKKDEQIQAKLLERAGKYIPRLVPITFSSEGGDAARRGWEGIAGSVLTRFEDKGGDEKLSKSDIALGKKWLSSEGKGNINYKKLTQGDKTYLILNKDGDEITIPLESREAIQLPINDPNEPSQEYKDVTEAQYLGDGNTNPTGKYKDSYFGRSQMPNTGLDIKGDLSWNKSNSAKQYIQLKLNTTNGVVPLQLDNNPMSRQDAMSFLRQLTKEQVKQLYLNNPSVSDGDKQAIKNL
jgi:hypothetical protein